MKKEESQDLDNSRVCRVAVSSKGNSIDSEIGSLGSSSHFIIFEGSPDKYTVTDNEVKGQGSEAGVKAADILKSKGIAVIITSNIGEKSIRAFKKKNIIVHAGCSGMVRDGIHKCLKGELPECEGVTYAGPMKW
jgi:predicted Fe-Mo cluster-binding NifX family protein